MQQSSLFTALSYNPIAYAALFHKVVFISPLLELHAYQHVFAIHPCLSGMRFIPLKQKLWI
ncbi:hypothetical protein PAT3040_03957 [Paenibacillus agaridevorans]|uniref:Uncharacterized protein n=1 Tax=Paenibacillus agaridevorans TaxID=171404 RepID=A0A2R5EZR3_9BACL|nr:hypothetical protein PAT3040_03957 [Paenibacillus agaridevorans]